MTDHARSRVLNRRRIGRTGIDVTALTLGGAGLGGLYGPVAEDAGVQTVLRAIDLGTPFYGECEQRYGKALVALGGRPRDCISVPRSGCIEENVAAATHPLPAGIWDEVEERMRRGV